MLVVLSLVFFDASLFDEMNLFEIESKKKKKIRLQMDLNLPILFVSFVDSFNRQAFHELRTAYQSVRIDCINNLRVSVSKQSNAAKQWLYNAKYLPLMRNIWTVECKRKCESISQFYRNVQINFAAQRIKWTLQRIYLHLLSNLVFLLREMFFFAYILL